MQKKKYPRFFLVFRDSHKRSVQTWIRLDSPKSFAIIISKGRNYQSAHWEKKKIEKTVKEEFLKEVLVEELALII